MTHFLRHHFPPYKNKDLFLYVDLFFLHFITQDDTRPSHHIAGRQRASGLQPGHQASARVSHAAGDIAAVPSRRLRYALARATLLQGHELRVLARDFVIGSPRVLVCRSHPHRMRTCVKEKGPQSRLGLRAGLVLQELLLASSKKQARKVISRLVACAQAGSRLSLGFLHSLRQT